MFKKLIFAALVVFLIALPYAALASGSMGWAEGLKDDTGSSTRSRQEQVGGIVGLVLGWGCAWWLAISRNSPLPSVEWVRMSVLWFGGPAFAFFGAVIGSNLMK